MKGMPVKHLFVSSPERAWEDWRWHMRHQVRSVAELLERLPGARAYVSGWETYEARLAESFRFAVTPYYLNLASPGPTGERHCPILAQILPHPAELADPHYQRPDPLAEELHSPVRGLTHRYPDRVLWYLSHRCAVYCRYCLRKRKVSRGDSAPTRDEYAEILQYIARNLQIKEVILSGGDPLALSDERIDAILESLRGIEHLSSIRIHTRMPVTLPMRITGDLAEVLRRHYPLTLVTHFNHAREITSEACAAVRRLRMAGVTVLNQSVLLKDINDRTQDQEDLILGLVRAGVIPYYLHRCDEVQGVSHFRVPLERGVEILRELRGRNPGIALPRYIVDLPGGGGKIALEPDYLIERKYRAESNEWIYRFYNWEGDREFIVTDGA
jgi:lysine 2,3-aminomutase